MDRQPDLLDIRAIWEFYLAGDWITAAYWCREFDVALWDFDGATCQCTFSK